MRIKVELSGVGYAQTTNILCEVGDTFAELKQKLRQRIPLIPEGITLYFDGATVHNDDTLASYGVKEGDLLKDYAQSVPPVPLDPALTPGADFVIQYQPNVGHFLSTSGKTWKYQYSSAVDAVLAKSLPKHYNNWKAKLVDKQNHPLYVISSGPGTGKSRMLEEFPHLCCKAVQDNSDIHTQLSNNNIILKMSFENGTQWLTTDSLDAEQELGLRAAYNFSQNYSNFLHFKNSVDKSRYKISQVVVSLLRSLGRPEKDVTVYLLVDGLQMLGSTIQKDVLRVLGAFVNNSTFFAIAAVAGTYLSPIRDILHDSPQWREELYPPPVQAHAIIESHGDMTIELLIHDVDYHGRAVEALQTKLASVVNAPNTFDLNTFMSGLREELNQRYPSLATTAPLHIRKAVLLVFTGAPVKLDTPLTGNFTVEHVLQVGLFALNNGRLHCPYILLWLFAKNSGIMELEEIDFATYEEQEGVLGRNQWQHWQHFVHLFHVVKSHIFAEGFYTGAEIYRGAKTSSDLSTLVLSNQPRKLLLATHQIPSRSGDHTPESLFTHKSGTAKVQDQAIFIENTYGASAGDAFGGVQIKNTDNTYEIVHEVIQDKKYQTSLSRTTFDEEYIKAATPGKDIFILFTTGNTAHNFFDTPLSPRSAVVSYTQLEYYFGPFAGRAFIAAGLHINQATAEQIAKVPYISLAAAEAIIREREKNGPFKNRVDFEDRTGKRNTLKRRFSDYLNF